MPEFTVELEYPGPQSVTKTLAALLRNASHIQFIDPLERGGLVARVNCHSDDVWRAMDMARRLVLTALAGAPEAIATHPIHAVRATPVGEYDRFVRLVGIAEIAEIYGVTRQRASVFAKTKSFPRPIETLRMGPVFSRRAVLRHKNQRHFRAL